MFNSIFYNIYSFLILMVRRITQRGHPSIPHKGRKRGHPSTPHKRKSGHLSIPYKRKRKHPSTLKRKKTIKGGGSSSPRISAETILEEIPVIPDTLTQRGDEKKTYSELFIWIRYDNLLRHIVPYTSDGILGTRTLSSKYIDRYKNISVIWGYKSHHGHTNYERLTHTTYKGQPLRRFQYFTDPLMRNLQRLSSEDNDLTDYDTIDFLKTIPDIIEFYKEQKPEPPEVTWMCDTVLPHFLKQSNISTLFWELAHIEKPPPEPTRRGNTRNPPPQINNDLEVLYFLSIAARIFLLLVVRKWDDMLDLLDEAGIVKKLKSV